MPAVAQGAPTEDKDGDDAERLLHPHGTSAERCKPIDSTTGETCGSIDVLTEEKRLLVDEDIAQNTAERACYHTHNHRHPHGIALGERLLDASDDEKG